MIQSKVVTKNNDNNDDYMSNVYLQMAKQNDNKRLKLNKKRKKYNNNNNISNNNDNIEPAFKKHKKLKERINEQREYGLNKKISKNNIGYKLLQKMGYNENKNKNIPIKLILNNNKQGLGKREYQNKLIIQKSIQIKKNNDKMKQIFIDKSKEYSKYKSNIKWYQSGLRICEELDIKLGINNNPIWYKDNNDNNIDGNNLDYDIDLNIPKNYNESIFKLNEILIYLRDKHYYCLWCGICFKNKMDMNDGCPGLERETHDTLTDF